MNLYLILLAFALYFLGGCVTVFWLHDNEDGDDWAEVSSAVQQVCYLLWPIIVFYVFYCMFQEWRSGYKDGGDNDES